MANLGVDIQIGHYQFTFHGHVKDALAFALPVHFDHLQCDVVGTVVYWQLIAEHVAVALYLIDLVVFGVSDCVCGTGYRTVGGEICVGSVDNSVTVCMNSCTDPHRNCYAFLLTVRTGGAGRT